MSQPSACNPARPRHGMLPQSADSIWRIDAVKIRWEASTKGGGKPRGADLANNQSIPS